MTHFDQAANEWDSPEKIKLMNTLAVKAISALNLSGTKLDIIDFGCGTGLFGLEFASYAKSITGIDTSEGMLKVFDEKTKDHDEFMSLNCDLEINDVDIKADLIVSSMTFHHLVNPSKILKKLKWMLSPGGRIVVVDLEKEDGTFHPDNEGMGVQHYGFTNEEIEHWANEVELNVGINTLNTLEKESGKFNQFIAIFSGK